MGRFWTVSGMARAALCAQLALTFSGCSNANLGWNYFPGYGHLHGYFPPLRVSGPNFLSAAATCSGEFKVGFSGSGGAYAYSTADVTLKLGGTGTPTFYSDSTCTTAITETTLASGSQSQSFYLKNPKAGTQQVQTTHPDLPPASRAYQVDPAPPASLKLIRGPGMIHAATCVEYEIGFLDAGGNQVPFDQTDTLTLTLSGGGAQDVFDQSDTFCQGFPSYSYSLFPGTWTQVVHIWSAVLGDSLVLGASTGTLTMTPFPFSTSMAVPIPTHVAISTIASQLQTGDCDQATAHPIDNLGNPFTSVGPTVITFSSPSANVQFFTDSNCTVPGNVDTANAGSFASIFVRGTVSEKTKIIATSAGLTDGKFDIDIANRALQAAAGDHHSCVMLKSGKVKCWGSNLNGQLGDAATAGSAAVLLSAAAEVVLPGPASLVAAGAAHTCAVVRVGVNSEVWCWGRSSKGQLGPGIAIGMDSAIPLQAFAPGNQIVDLTAGAAHTCAVESGGNLWCWGDDVDGQTGDVVNFGTQSSTPALVAGNTGFVTASGNSTCALDFTSNLGCFGSNALGQLQLDPAVTSNSVVPILISASTAVLGLGPSQACRMDDSVFDLSCWGRNSYGELGSSTALGSMTFTPVSTGVQRLAPPKAVSGGDGFTCVTLYSGVLCFGRNDAGQLGIGTQVSTSDPTLVQVFPNLQGLNGMATGKSHTCAAQGDGSLVCWGLNDHAQLGPSPATKPYSSTPLLFNL